jgi:hypothetical protein
MKKTLLTVLFVTGALSLAFSQSLSLSYNQGTLPANGVITLQGSPSDPMVVVNLDVTNNSAQTVSVKVKKVEVFFQAGAELSLCWAGNCYPPGIYETPSGQPIDPGQTVTNNFGGEFFPNNTSAGLSSVSFVFFDEDNTADSVQVSVNFDITDTPTTLELYTEGGTLIPDNSEISFSGLTTDQTIQSKVTVKNNGVHPADVYLRKIENRLVPATISYFCWGVCVGPDVTLSPVPVNIPAGQSTNEFTGDYEPGGLEGESTVTYVFFNDADTSDYVAVVVKYNAVINAIGDQQGDLLVTGPNPNPADDYTRIAYNPEMTGNSIISVYDLCGRLVNRTRLVPGDHQVTLDTSGLGEGLYLVSFTLNNRVVRSQKLLIRH